MKTAARVHKASQPPCFLHRLRDGAALACCLSLWLTLDGAGTARAADAGASKPIPSPAAIHVLDARSLRRVSHDKPDEAARVWDTMHALAALQGIVNRDSPRLYLLYCRRVRRGDGPVLARLVARGGWLAAASRRWSRSPRWNRRSRVSQPHPGPGRFTIRPCPPLQRWPPRRPVARTCCPCGSARRPTRSSPGSRARSACP